MVISVSHLTDQVEIAGGGHAPILSGARGPAPPPSAGPRTPNPNTNPTPSPASGSYTSVPLGEYDDPFQCHFCQFFVSVDRRIYNGVIDEGDFFLHLLIPTSRIFIIRVIK